MSYQNRFLVAVGACLWLLACASETQADTKKKKIHKLHIATRPADVKKRKAPKPRKQPPKQRTVKLQSYNGKLYLRAPGRKISVQELGQRLPTIAREIPPAVQGLNDFGLKLYKRLRKTHRGNLFFAPYSVANLLAMIETGAQAQTGMQIVRALGISQLWSRRHKTMRLLNRLLQLHHAKGLDLHLANGIWGKQTWKYNPFFQKALRDYYQTSLQKLPFHKPERARQHINKWISKHSKGQLKGTLPRGSIKPDTGLLAANVIRFHGQWASKFPKKSTALVDFHLNPKKRTKVHMMFQSGKFPVAFLREGKHQLTLVEIPYKGGRFAMSVLLPPLGQLDTIASQLTAAKLNAWHKKLHARFRIYLFLPKFRIQSNLKLTQTLAALGIRDAFSRKANFKNITAKRIALSRVLHQAAVSVDEKGTKAAAVTVGKFITISMPPSVRINRPFLFFIRDRNTNTILFLGRVTHPKP